MPTSHILQYEGHGKYYAWYAIKSRLSKDKALLTPAFGRKSKGGLFGGRWVGNISNFFAVKENRYNFMHSDWVLMLMCDLVCRCITEIISKQKIFKYI